MKLSGFERSCVSKGGVKRIELIAAREIVSVRYDSSKTEVREIELKAGSAFKQYQFAEGEAEYREKVTTKSGVTRVRHTLSFSLKGMQAQSRRAAEELVEVSRREGVVAIVTTQEGVEMLVGYSPRFRAEQPLRVDVIWAESGAKTMDGVRRKVKMESEDVEGAIKMELT